MIILSTGWLQLLGLVGSFCIKILYVPTALVCGVVVLMNIFLLQWMLSDIAYVCYYPHFIDEKTKALTGPITQRASGLAW